MPQIDQAGVYGKESVLNLVDPANIFALIYNTVNSP